MYVGSYLTNEVSVALGPASFSVAKSSADASWVLNVDCEIAAIATNGAMRGAHWVGEVAWSNIVCGVKERSASRSE